MHPEIYFISAESPLARGGREKGMTVQEDSVGKYGEGFSKGSVNLQGPKESGEGPRSSNSQDGGEFLQDEVTRKRELALRQHAFFQLRLHIRKGANLVAMDRCGKREDEIFNCFIILLKKKFYNICHVYGIYIYLYMYMLLIKKIIKNVILKPVE